MERNNDDRISKGQSQYFSVDFSNITESGLKEFTDYFNRYSCKVVELIASNRAGRKNGEKQKKATFIFENGQAVTVWFNDEGHVFQVKLNSSIIPVTAQKTIGSFIKELIKVMTANQKKFDKAMARKAAAVIKDTSKVKTARKTFDQQLAEVNTALAAVNSNIRSNKTTINQLQLDNSAMNSNVDKLRLQYQALESEENSLIEQIEALGGEI